jgi:hypothetical protein
MKPQTKRGVSARAPAPSPALNQRPPCPKLRRDRLQHSLAHFCRLRPDTQLHFHCVGCTRPASSGPLGHEETALALAIYKHARSPDACMRARGRHHGLRRSVHFRMHSKCQVNSRLSLLYTVGNYVMQLTNYTIQLCTTTPLPRPLSRDSPRTLRSVEYGRAYLRCTSRLIGLFCDVHRPPFPCAYVSSDTSDTSAYLRYWLAINFGSLLLFSKSPITLTSASGMVLYISRSLLRV